MYPLLCILLNEINRIPPTVPLKCASFKCGKKQRRGGCQYIHYIKGNREDGMDRVARKAKMEKVRQFNLFLVRREIKGRVLMQISANKNRLSG